MQALPLDDAVVLLQLADSDAAVGPVHALDVRLAGSLDQRLEGNVAHVALWVGDSGWMKQCHSW